eukprot:gene30141-37307_t
MRGTRSLTVTPTIISAIRNMSLTEEERDEKFEKTSRDTYPGTFDKFPKSTFNLTEASQFVEIGHLKPLGECARDGLVFYDSWDHRWTYSTQLRVWEDATGL